jgi:hypothetical protein
MSDARMTPSIAKRMQERKSLLLATEAYGSDEQLKLTEASSERRTANMKHVYATVVDVSSKASLRQKCSIRKTAKRTKLMA